MKRCIPVLALLLCSAGLRAQTPLRPGTASRTEISSTALPPGWTAGPSGSLTGLYRNDGKETAVQLAVAFSWKGAAAPALQVSTDGKLFRPVSGPVLQAAQKAALLLPVNLAPGAACYLRFTSAAGSANVTSVRVQVSSSPIVTATMQDLLQTDGGTPGGYDEGDVIRYKVVIKNNGTSDATAVEAILPIPANTTAQGGISSSALARDDQYTTSYTTALSGSTVLANDFGIPAPTAISSYGKSTNSAAATPGTGTLTDQNGTVTMTAGGTFSYTPPAGFAGADAFKYVINNGNGPSNDATVTITVAPDITIGTTSASPLCNGGATGAITVNATGGNGALQYALNNGAYQASNSFTGLAGGTYTVKVKDAGGYVKSSQVVLADPAPLTVSGTIGNQVFNNAMTSTAFTKTGGTGTVTFSASNLPTGLAISASGVVSGTATQTGTFSYTVTATDANGCTATRTGSFTVAPNLSGDSYTGVVGNTQLIVGAYSNPSTPYTTSSVNLVANDAADVAIAVTAVTNAATAQGGSISINASGKLAYTPPAGFSGTDTYTYTGTANGVSATATISFTVSASRVWYVNSNYGGGASNGTSTQPFTGLASVNAASASGDYIYVHTGTVGGALTLKSSQTLRGAGNALSVGALQIAAGTKPTLSGTITLASNVTVDGFDMNTAGSTAFTNNGAAVTGVSVNVGTVATGAGTGIALTGTGSNVTMTLASLTTTGAANAVTIAGSAGSITINGGTQTNSASATFAFTGGTLGFTYAGTVSQTNNAAIVSVSGGHSAGTLSFSGNLSATNGTGLQFDNADGTYSFTGTNNFSNSVGGGDAAIDILNGSSGTFTFGSGFTITNPANNVLQVSSSAPTVTYSGGFTKNNNAVSGISITSNTGGTISINGTVAGTKILNTSTAAAVNLTNNTNATINFTGGSLSITTTSGTGFNATGGGTVNVTGSGNIISSPTGTALNVSNTTIGASGLLFQSISSVSSATATGIILSNTGSSGSLQVAGNGTAGSGGTIANKTGSDNVFTTGCGIYLSNTMSPSFTRMQLNDFAGHAIYGSNVNGFTLSNCVISGTNGNNSAGGVTEGSIMFSGLTGSVSITSCNISGGYTNNLYVVNSSGVLNRLTLSSTTIGANSTANGNDGVLVEGTGTATVNVTVQTCTFTSARGDLLQVTADGSGGGDLSVTGSNFSNNHPAIGTGGGGLSIFGGATGTFTVNFDNNTFKNAVGHALLFVKSQGSGNFTATVNNNQIGVAGTANSGSTEGAGIKFQHAGSGSTTWNQFSSRFTLNITNNQIRQYNNEGILIQAGAGIANSGNIIASISGNTIGSPGNNPNAGNIYQGLNINSGVTPGDNFVVCANFGFNTINGSGRNGGVDFRVRARQATTVRLPGYSGSAYDTNASMLFIQAKIGGNPSGSTLADNTGGGFSGTSCQ